MKKILLAFIPFCLISCGGKKLADVETLGTFRVLAIQTSTPELTQTTGLSVTAKPFVSDISSGGRTVSGLVEGCVDPGVSSGAVVTCDGNPTRVFSAYSVDTSGLTMQTGWGGLSSSLAIPDAIFAGRSAREKFNGVPFLIIFSFDVDGATSKYFRRVLITNRTTLNANPSLTALKLNGGAIGKPKNGDYLNATYSGVETYDYMRADGLTESRTEKLMMAWYVNSGTFDMPKATAAESVQYKTDPPSGQMLIIGILRDERGGVDVVQTVQ